MTLHQKLARAILQCLSSEMPPNEAIIELRWPDQQSMVVNVKAQTFWECSHNPQPIAEPVEQEPPSPREVAIQRVIDGLGPDDRLSAEEIARQAGYSLCGSLKQLLADMAKEEKIASFGRGGYGRF